MNTIRLDEQMGAMALIDALREQQLRVEEHLDLQRRREAIAQRIREYYVAHGQQVDDAMIAEGVRAYFADRLTWKSHGFTGWQARLVGAYVRRELWLPKVRTGLGIIAMLCAIGAVTFVGGEYVTAKIEAWQTEQALHDLDQQAAPLNARQLEFNVLLGVLESRSIRYGKPMVDGLLSDLRTKIEALPALERPQEATVKEWTDRIAAAQAASAAVRDDYDRVRRLVAADRRLVEIENSAEVATFKDEAELVRAMDVARKALQGKPVAYEAESAIAAVNRADQAFDAIQAGAVMRQELASLRSEAKGLPLNAKDRAVFDEIFARAQQEMATDIKQASATFGEARALLQFAGEALELQVVNRSGVKSGVERTYDASGGKAWYVIVEAVTTSGRVVPVRVTNSETGRTEWASTFGVRVSQNQYEQVKQDKLADGIVDDKSFATKARGQLEFNYSRAVMPGMITAW